MKKITIITAIVLALYALFSFFALPCLLKPRLIKTVSELTGRQAMLGKVSTNPFALSVTLRDFSLADRNEERVFKRYSSTRSMRTLCCWCRKKTNPAKKFPGQNERPPWPQQRIVNL